MTGINRRHFIKGAGTTLALPFLASLQSNAFGKEKTAPSPQRMIFLCFGWGVTKETWFPSTNESGKNWQITPGLKPLEKYKDDFTIIQNTQHKFLNEGHWGSTFYLTGANRYGVPGKSFHNTISVDQVAAAKWGKNNRYSSMPLDCVGAESQNGHGPGLSASWNNSGKPLSGLKSPFLLYNKLFGNEKMTPKQKQHMINEKKSSLDIILTDLKRVNKKLSANDRDKLNEYLESVRNIETNLAKELNWLYKPKPKATVKPPAKTVKGYDEIKLMYDLMIAALQTDSTRVFTYRQPVQSLLDSLGLATNAHDMTHYARGIRYQNSQIRDEKQSELLAYFISKLKKTEDQNGQSLFDTTTLSYGSNISNVHHLNNCPAIITGNRQNLQLGQQLIMPEKTPLCNLWLTLLKASGIDQQQFGDSTGLIEDLLV
ncbi:MAG: DUF1552 domain-containing protein [Lentisphaeraceae bacterium]|nr:DUF1552 domain-containing protein [Lentisphaeraceae bacterium]